MSFVGIARAVPAKLGTTISAGKQPTSRRYRVETHEPHRQSLGMRLSVSQRKLGRDEMAPEMHWLIGLMAGIAILAVGLSPLALVWLALLQ